MLIVYRHQVFSTKRSAYEMLLDRRKEENEFLRSVYMDDTTGSDATVKEGGDDDGGNGG
jgi:hypothetical protein